MVHPHTSNTSSSGGTATASLSIPASSSRGPLTLPLLEGLAQHKGQADVIVKEALEQWQAALRIATFCQTWRRRRKNNQGRKHKKRRKSTTTAPARSTLSSSSSHKTHASSYCFHWLFESLQSSSTPERQVACRILAMGCPLEAHALWQVLEILVTLLWQGHQSHAAAVTMVALIKHIVLLPLSKSSSAAASANTTGAPSTTSTTTNQNFVLAFLRNKHMGLSWMCTLLWKQASSAFLHCEGREDPADCAVVVSSALVDLLYHLLLVGTTTLEELQVAHAFLWKQNATADATPSPLSCLLATQLLWKQHKHELHPAQKDVLHVLKQLLDPHTVPTKLHSTVALGPALDLLSTVAASSTSSLSITRSLRLMDTLRSPPTTLNATAAAIAEAIVNSPANKSSTSSSNSNNLLSPPGPPPLFSRDSAADRSATAAAVARIFSAVYGPNSPAAAGAGGGSSSSLLASTTATQQALELFGASMSGSPLAAAAAAARERGGLLASLGTRSAAARAAAAISAAAASNNPAAALRASTSTTMATTRGGAVTARSSSSSNNSNNRASTTLNNNNNEPSSRPAAADAAAAMDVDEDPREPRHSDDEEDDHGSGEEDDDEEIFHHLEDDDRRGDAHHHPEEEDEDLEQDDEEHHAHSDDEEDDDHEEHEEDEEHEEGEHAEDDEEHEESHHGEDEEHVDAQVKSTTNNNANNDDEDDDDDDEEIDSDDEDCEFDNDVEEGGASSGEHDIVIHEEHDDEDDDIDIAGFRQRLMDLHHEAEDEERPAAPPSGTQAEGSMERKQVYIKACMQVLANQYHSAAATAAAAPMAISRKPILPIQAEHDLMHSVLNIVKPPKKPVNAKIILRRAPTQEDFFRGSLSKNPVSLHQLRKDTNREPTVRDLRQHIADDLQMSDSAELLELLVANKIIDVDLKLRVVHQVVWKRHLIQNSGPATSSTTSALSSLLGGGRGVARSLISARSGLSMIFSSSGLPGASSDTNGNAITEDTPLSALPPMVVTYRLTGVDGEATEDTVTTLEDPEAPSETADPKQKEKLMEKEFGITRSVTEGRGVFCLLKSVERNINDTLRRIRRDDIGTGDNLSRAHFKTSSPYPGLTLLSCCAKLASNRKLLLQSRAPTILLRLLLDVLHALEDEGLSESNPTAKDLQELIEILATDMQSSNGVKDVEEEEVGEDAEQDASTLRLLLGAIETSSLSRPLRNVIAKLLPYLTYGQAALSKELAMEFVRHVDVYRLVEYEYEQDSQVLMATFVHTSTSLPANDVCNSLRAELIQCGYVERIAAFVLENCPSDPPYWTASLWDKGDSVNAKKRNQLEKQWRNYLQRPGLKPAFDMLIGLSKQHKATQGFIGTVANKRLSLIQACHWIEATSDNSSARITMNGLGLVAETLLDELSSQGSPVATQVKELRDKTRNRKKEIAMERRSKALSSMGAYGASKKADPQSPEQEAAAPPTGVRGTAASFLAPVLGLFQNSEQAPPAKRRKKDTAKGKEDEPPSKPAWMTEMEKMEDETGLTCAVCQEGRTLQPSELLGLYAYVKKVSVPLSQCGGRNHIDGTTLLTALPPSMPSSLSDSHAATEWFPAARAAGEDLRESSRSSLSSVASSRRATYFTTTVSAGNAIHFSCHNRARQADRNHPKAPKSEWEGASLRNSRVNCNVIMPLVSSRSSKVPLVAVDVALTEHQTAISNLLGARPKSMLWNILHDVRFLLLRMAYGEPLNADCGGGSLVSNTQLVFHQLLMADMFEKDAQVDAPEMAQHARNLSAGFLAASAITQADDSTKRNQTLLHRGLADSAVMACLTCILFHNTKDDFGASVASASSDDDERPHPKRRWVVGREYFLRGLLNCAGRRHALGVEGSGCVTNRIAGAKRRRPAGFADWDIVEEDEMLELGGGSSSLSAAAAAATSASLIRNNTANIEDFKDALRPMIVYFAMMDRLSEDFVLSLDDSKVEELANRLVQVINDCQACKNIHELLQKARITLEPDEIMEELQKGMMAA